MNAIDQIITVTPKAEAEILRLLSQDPDPNEKGLKRCVNAADNDQRTGFSSSQKDSGTTTLDSKRGLRIQVVQGGCSGLSYKLDYGFKETGDFTFSLKDYPVFIDQRSLDYIKGMSLDFTDGFKGRGFIFNNPNAVLTCHCGESFAV